jgi:hypothetical protein
LPADPCSFCRRPNSDTAAHRRGTPTGASRQASRCVPRGVHISATSKVGNNGYTVAINTRTFRCKTCSSRPR